MKGIIIATLSAVLCIANCLAVPTCPPPGPGDIQLFPKPDNCSQYYECDNGQLRVMSCPAGLEFNAQNKTCDYPYSANCKVSRKVLYVQAEEELQQLDLPTCPPPGPGDIQLFPKPDNCSQYYECDNGQLRIMSCPAGLEFNAQNMTCDYPYSANCKVSRKVLYVQAEEELQQSDLPTCPPPGPGEIQIFPKPDNCSQYYECDNGQLRVMSCPAGLEFNAQNKTCDYPYSANCKISRKVLYVQAKEEQQQFDLPTCPPPGPGDIQIFPKPDNCSQYYECDNGQLLVMNCPLGLQFNALNKTCDYSWSANCKVSRKVLFVQAEEEQEVFDLPTCPPPGPGEIQIFPKPDNCSQYYECDNGQLRIMSCPPGLQFNAQNKTCDYPYSANCKVSPKVLYVHMEQPQLDLPTCPPPGAGDIQLFPKPDNCSQYYECDNGQLRVMNCPAGLEFNAQNNTCDYPYSANCKVSRKILSVHAEEEDVDLPTCPPPGPGEIQLFPKPDNCSQYYECDNGQLLVMSCPPGLQFNAQNNTCDYPYSANCKVSRSMIYIQIEDEDNELVSDEEDEEDFYTLPTCPPPGPGDIQLFPKPDNCSQYYECDNGQLLTMDCPAGLEFNAMNSTCDYTWSANCKVSQKAFFIAGKVLMPAKANAVFLFDEFVDKKESERR